MLLLRNLEHWGGDPKWWAHTSLAKRKRKQILCSNEPLPGNTNIWGISTYNSRMCSNLNATHVFRGRTTVSNLGLKELH